jgi:hypothetical protein
MFFKNACPCAYSYAYYDATSTFTCASGTASYLLVFCPTTTAIARFVHCHSCLHTFFCHESRSLLVQ